MALGPEPREWRRCRFLAQQELAARLRVAWQSVARWQADEAVPRASHQRRLVEALQIEPDAFFAARKASEQARLRVAA